MKELTELARPKDRYELALAASGAFQGSSIKAAAPAGLSPDRRQ
jgi:hypothetical protein